MCSLKLLTVLPSSWRRVVWSMARDRPMDDSPSRCARRGANCDRQKAPTAWGTGRHPKEGEAPARAGPDGANSRQHSRPPPPRAAGEGAGWQTVGHGGTDYKKHRGWPESDCSRSVSEAERRATVNNRRRRGFRRVQWYGKLGILSRMCFLPRIWPL